MIREMNEKHARRMEGNSMNTEIKAALEKAIDQTIEQFAEDSLWDGYIHNDLFRQMAEAAALVFDAAMEAQEFADRESGRKG